MFSLPLLAITTALLSRQTSALYPPNGLAQTPQMGWDNWNFAGCDVNEDLLLQTATKMVDIGLRDVGYNYVILDDCWSDGRYDNGSLRPDFNKFPNGMADVADQLHSMGLKFGMYSSAGSYTCARYAGSLGHEQDDANSFASWGVDYLKYDNCYNEGQSGTPLITSDRYRKMGDALNSTGRQILYSLCEWGEDYPWKWAQTIANSWRMSGDIYDSFNRPDPRCPCDGNVDDQGYNCALPGFHCSVMNILSKVAHFVDKGVPGAWNDLDALEVGNGGMSDDEYKTHFSMWAAVKSPMLMGNNVVQLSPSSLSILTNPAVLAISQDPLGSAAVRRWRYEVPDVDQYGQGEIQMWTGSLYAGDQVVVLLNGGNSSRTMNATSADIFADYGEGGTAKQTKQSWQIYDLWANRMDNATASAILSQNSTQVQGAGLNVTQYYYNATATNYAEGLKNNDTRLLGKEVGTLSAGGSIQTMVPRHGVAMYRLSQIESVRKRDEL